jgi:hypothetical protein
VSKSYDVVAYTYRADNFCPDCIVATLGNERDVALASLLGTEDALTALATLRGIDREDERSFDSGEFPKVVFRDQLGYLYQADGVGASNVEHCASCGRELGE